MIDDPATIMVAQAMYKCFVKRRFEDTKGGSSLFTAPINAVVSRREEGDSTHTTYLELKYSDGLYLSPTLDSAPSNRSR